MADGTKTLHFDMYVSEPEEFEQSQESNLDTSKKEWLLKRAQVEGWTHEIRAKLLTVYRKEYPFESTCGLDRKIRPNVVYHELRLDFVCLPFAEMNRQYWLFKTAEDKEFFEEWHSI